MGAQRWFRTACQILPSKTPAMSTPDGVIMKVTHAFAMNMSVVPEAFRRRPTPICAHLRLPADIGFQP